MSYVLRFFCLAAAVAISTPSARAVDPKPFNEYGAYNAAPAQDWKLVHAFDTGPATSLDQVVKQLSWAIDRLSPHRIPRTPANIRRISHAQLQSYVCETNCAIKAWYKPGEGIFLDETLQPETNIFDRSILLHELVHYFQDASGYYRDAAPCDRWLQRELDAYAVQNRYLGTIGHPRRVAYAGTNCHSHATAEDGIIRRQVFNGTTRDVDLDD